MKCILVAPTNGPFKGGMVCSFHETRLEAFKMQCYLSNGSFLEILFIFYIRFSASEYMPSYSLAFVVLVVSSNLLFVLGQRRPGPRQQNSVVRAKLARGQTFSEENKQAMVQNWGKLIAGFISQTEQGKCFNIPHWSEASRPMRDSNTFKSFLNPRHEKAWFG